MSNEAKLDREQLKAELEALGVPFAKNASEKTLQKLYDGQEHTVTQEDLDLNPELAEQGVVVGDLIHLAYEGGEETTEEDTEEPETQKEEKKTSKPGHYEVVTTVKLNGRTYQPGETLNPEPSEAKSLLERGAVKLT